MSDPAETTRNCSACGDPLPSETLRGLCPKCLLLAGMEGEAGRHLHIRCPQCHVPIEIIDDESLKDVTCPSCDSRFSLVGEQAATIVPDDAATVGRFELIERVGVGAFGSVWKARDPVLDRIVAVKVPRKEQLAAEETEQFVREARAVARLKHPGIVSVHEVGRDADRVYIVSDFIQGVTLADWLSARKPTSSSSAELCAEIARALQHAHDNGVIHRDLKPSNIMLDDANRPHVMDFGLAKREAAEVTITVDGRILGTPAYMSPEQARGEAHTADARSDVYSLGVILFELLTGEMPFRGASRMLLHQVLHDDAPSPRSLNGSVPRDLETICLKCLEKEPARRYPSALAVAEELQRFLDGKPIHARPITRPQRGWRWCRRNPVIAGLTAAVAASLLIGLATTVSQWRVAQDNFEDAEQARGIAVERATETAAALDESQSRLARLFVERGLREIDVDPHAGLPWLIQALREEPENSAARKMHRLRIGLMLHELPTLLGYWPQAADARFSEDGTKVAIAVQQEAIVYELAGMRPIGPLPHDAPVAGLYFTRQGDRLATIARDGDGPPQCRIWDARTGEATTEVLNFQDDEFGMRDTPRVSFTEDGGRFVVVRAGMYNRWHSKMTTRVFDSRTLEPVSPTFSHHSQLDYMDGYHKLSPDALRVLVPQGVAGDDPNYPWSGVGLSDWPDDMRPQQFNLMTGNAMHPPLDHALDFYAWGQFVYSADGSLIATSEGGVLKVWDGEAGLLLQEFPLSTEESYANLQFHPDGERLFAIEDGRACCWDVVTGELKREWRHEDSFFISPDGQYAVYTDSGNGSAYVRSIAEENSDEIGIPDVYRVHFCDDGSRFLLDPPGHDEGGIYISPPVRIHQSADGRPVTPPWRFEGNGVAEPFSVDGRYFLTRDDDGAWLWDLNGAQSLVEPFPAEDSGRIIDAAFSRDRKTLAVLGANHTLTCWDTGTAQQRHDPVLVPRTTATGIEIEWGWILLNHSADLVAVMGSYPDPAPDDNNRDAHLLQIWSLASGRAPFKPIVFDEHAKSWIDTVQFTIDDRQIAVSEFLYHRDEPDAIDRTRLHVFDAASGAPVRSPLTFEHTFRLSDVADDGQQCLVMREDSRWDVPRKDPVFANGIAQMYSTRTWEPLTPMMTPDGQAHARNVTLSPDGRRLAMGAAELWDTATGEQLTSSALAHRPVGEFVFRNDSSAFIAVTDGGSGYWDDSSEVRFFSTEDGSSLSPPMTNTRIGAPWCALHPETDVIAAAGHGLRFWDAASGAAITAAFDLDVENGTGRVLNQNRSTTFSADGRRLYIEASRRLFVIRWSEIVESIPPDEVLDAWSGILSGSRVDAAGGVIPMTAADFQQAWTTVQPNHNN